MTDIQLVWLSTIIVVVLTAAIFAALAVWSAGGPAPWSIVPGVARGVRDWVEGHDDEPPAHSVSPQAVEPEPPMDTEALPLAPLSTAERPPEAWLEEGVDSGARAEIELEDLGSRRT